MSHAFHAASALDKMDKDVSHAYPISVPTSCAAMAGCKSNRRKGLITHFRQIILSWLYFLARICRDGSIMPPRSRSTRCRVDSASRQGGESVDARLLDSKLPMIVDTYTRSCMPRLYAQAIPSLSRCDCTGCAISCHSLKLLIYIV